MNEINFFAQTSARGQKQKFGIKLDDRRRHMYVIGKTGMGKTQMLQNMAIQDVLAGRGVGIIDPHGEFAEAVLDFIPKSRINDVVYFNPADTEMPIGFNIMESVGAEQNHLIAAGLMAAFKKIWVDVWSARMEYILNNTLLALLEYPNATIMGANRMLADKDYRKKVVDNVKDSSVKSYWINEFAKYPERYREEATGAIQNKIGQFISNPLIRNIIGQTKSTFNMREVMDNKKILIINLSKGRIGEDNTALLGTMLITKLQIAAMSRVDMPEDERDDFFMYIDEFQTFSTPSFAGILSEARKYRLALILAHQYITQMDEIVRDAVFGNAGTLVSFRVGAADAEFMENEFIPAFLQTDLVNLGKYNIAIKLMIDGIASNAFSATTLPPFIQPEESHREKIIRVSRERHGRPQEVVAEKITRWSGIMVDGGGNKEGDQQSTGKFTPKEIKEEFDAECSDCKRSIKVPFKPDPNRPVYCRECFEKRKEAREKGSPLPVPSSINSKIQSSTTPQSPTGVSSDVKTSVDRSIADKPTDRRVTRNRDSSFKTQTTLSNPRSVESSTPVRTRLDESGAGLGSEGVKNKQEISIYSKATEEKKEEGISLQDLPARSDQSRSEARPTGAARAAARPVRSAETEARRVRPIELKQIDLRFEGQIKSSPNGTRDFQIRLARSQAPPDSLRDSKRAGRVVGGTASTIGGKSRKKVNLASLRESLPHRPVSSELQRGGQTNLSERQVASKKEISGIIKEGEKINF